MMRIAIVAGGVFFLVMGVVFFRGMLHPARFRKQMFEGWTGVRFDQSVVRDEPVMPFRQVLAGVLAIVFVAFGILLLVVAVNYVDPETGAAEKARMDRHFRESTEAHLRERNEAFSQQEKDGRRFPVPPGRDAEAPAP